MYQPRRADGPAAETVAQARRASRTWYAATADRIGAIFLGLAVTATAGALAMAGTASAAPVAAPAATPDVSVQREQGVSRSDARAQLAAEDLMTAAAATRDAEAPALRPTRTMYAKDKVAVLTGPGAGAKKVATLDAADTLTVTPDTDGKYRKVSYKGEQAWVLKAALSNSKPTIKQVADANAPKATRSVPKGSVLGLQPEAMEVYRAVMARWAVKNVGGYRATSLSVHQFGRAIDFMTYTNVSQGEAIAAFVIAHAKEFGIDHVIYRQRIWTPYRPTWRHMADRGSITANHYDHVHVAVKDR
ncbi:SH3 domain-containing protein [Micropruina sonneratiae]|uniref:SH3 domain-containing protein n=1 Tax=Micropruina sonneratiae TaxID=2986940 RepID=UPI002227EE36|nr:SH3 domain-containing protein [Micropruina sp. KQZ13P-5]MCW3156669.1 SH3 domain-containing protein [Micropruina sp. KQZ13P-5]